MLEVKPPELREHIRRKLQNIGNLPSLPQVITEVSMMLDDERTNANDLCKVISRDQGIVAKLLAVANSPLYGLPRRVSTVEFAIIIIGFEHIKNILVALSLVEAFKTRNSSDWNQNVYWTHSLLTATAAKRIADDLRYPKSGEVFTAGLLHDLGLAVLQRFLNSDFKKIILLKEKEDITFLAAEEKILGFTHQDIGEFLLEKWNFPPYINEAVLCHHNPSLSEKGQVLASLIHLADYMTHRLSIGSFEWDNSYELDENIVDILGFGSFQYLEEFINGYEQLFKSHLESINL
ncbi:MAG: histidine kinase [Ignavibacteriae bacterium HGW-Ignavibacteriae-3]|nr:MAG: histidine kinase [Ignavibacteriae bacterium HGW-Ignavibacteriae-3]